MKYIPRENLGGSQVRYKMQTNGTSMTYPQFCQEESLVCLTTHIVLSAIATSILTREASSSYYEKYQGSEKSQSGSKL